MKKLAMKEALRKKLTKAGALALAAVVAMGGGVTYYNSQNQVPELITYVDTDGSIEIPDEDVPLAAPKVTKSTKTKKKIKKIKMKKASKKTYKTDTNLVAKLKADADARNAQFKSLVEQMLTKQGKTFNNANDIWKVLASGDFTVDPATKAQAQADIAEDGYWGVSQTSQRILDFATALTGGDPDKIEDMRAAFKKGYEQAEKTWGGSLPEISQKTYDAVMEKFDKLAADAGLTTEE